MSTAQTRVAPAVRSKLPGIGDSIFAKMSALSAKHQSLNMGQGFPEFSGPPELADLVSRFMGEGRNQYAPMQGTPELRHRLAEDLGQRHGIAIDPEKEINITSGATEAIFCAISAVVHEGDEVVLFEPAYDCYAPAIQLNNGIPIYVSLEGPDFAIDWEAVRNRVNARTRLIILNNPHNPTGATLSKDDLVQLQKLVAGTDMLILSDEVYEHIVFDNKAHTSVLAYPELRSRSFAIYSFGKSFHNTGWKMGYVLAPDALMREFRRIHQFVVFSSPTPLQLAFANFKDSEGYFAKLSSQFQERRDHFARALAGSRWKVLPCSGTYFQLLDYSNISQDQDVAFAEKLTVEHGITAIPISPFFSRKAELRCLRFCFAKDLDTLDRAAAILQEI